ncbi:MAG: cytochrome P450 [Egibacteraceae bacterium]
MGSRGQTKAVPGPRGAPLIGSALDLRRDPLGTLERAMREHGDVVRIAAGPPGARLAIYALFHPDGVQRVLASHAAGYRKDNQFYAELRATGGDGLLTSQDDLWVRQKRFIQPLFTRGRIAGYALTMADEAARLLDSWRTTQANGGGDVIDLHAEMTSLTLRIVGRVLFGSEVDEAIPIVRDAFPILGEHMQKRGMSPVRTPRSWPTPANRRAAKAQRALYGVCDALIARRRAAATGEEDLLGLLLAARDDGQALDNEEIRDQALVFMLAGHETTAGALTFALHLLAGHPDVQRRARDEVDEALGGRTPTAEDAAALGYTTMALKEALRLYPPGWALGRRTREGDRVNGYEIPPGSDLFVSPWATHRHPAFWPDPERFDPERFAPEQEAARHRYAWIPFGGGPRACIGQHFALLEAVIVIAMALQAYELTAMAGRVPLAVKTTLRPASAVPCRITARDARSHDLVMSTS